MALQTIEQLFKILRGDANELIGEMETQWLDFKSEPHVTPGGKTEPHHRLALAKDVCAMANAGGGVLLIGVRTEKTEKEHAEVAAELRPVPVQQFDPQQVHNVLDEWVFPSVEVVIEHHEVPGMAGMLWTLRVLQQSDVQLPFLLVREFEGEDSRMPSRIIFGVYRRRGTDNMPVSPQEAHRWMQIGHAATRAGPTEVVGRGHADLPALEASGTGIVESTSADDALDRELAALDQQEGAVAYFIQFIPVGSGTLRDFFAGSGNALEERMARLEQVRPSGFGLPWRAGVERTRTNELRLGWAGSSSVSVTPGGLATFACGQDLLTWASDKHAPDGQLYINPVALPEFTLEACRFFLGDVLMRGGTTLSAYDWRVGMRGLGDRVRMPRGRYGDIPAKFSAGHPGSEPNAADDFVSEWTRSDELDAGKQAFRMMEAVFIRFGYGPDRIPFQHEGRISEDDLRELG